MSEPEFDIVVVGASGLTGRLVAEEIARQALRFVERPNGFRWAVAGRDPERTNASLDSLGDARPQVLRMDLTDAASLPRLTRRTKVVLNLAGPYTPTARGLIAACIDAGTHYADLSGEIPLLREIVERFHDAAAQARVRIVQMAGWEALPADLTTLLASRRALECAGEGPGAGGNINEVTVTVRFHRTPKGRLPLSQALSAGTLRSIVQILGNPQAGLIARTDTLLPQHTGEQATPGSLRLRPFRVRSRVMAPFAPVAFLNPPVIHRTAALRAAEEGEAYRPANYREGEAVGLGTGALASAWWRCGMQQAIIVMARAPQPVRSVLAKGLERILPPSGTGPSGRFLTDWDWTVHSVVRTRDGRVSEASLDGQGHPGYAATAAMIAEIGLRMSFGRVPDRFGCLPPALALGSLDLDPCFVGCLQLR